MKKILLFIFSISFFNVFSQGSYGEWEKKFEQLGTMLPTPNSYRTASGAPGIDYWQQQADYKIDVILNDENQMLYGEESITYYNNSPDILRYLWVQLDQNMRSDESNTPLVTPSTMPMNISGKSLQSLTNTQTNSKGEKYDGGFKIEYVQDENNNPLDNKVIQTMMRIELPEPLKTGEKFSFKIKWSYEINDRMKLGGRGGYEYFEKDKNYNYTIAQFFPRMAVYDDKEGWQNKQFLGRGEFALPFGDYELNITVPSDFIVGATGALQNAEEVLNKKELERLELARKTYDKPVIITTQEEAIKKEKNPIRNKSKTWRFKATMVRDVAFAASRKYIWDAMAVELDNNKPLAMSYYSKEGNPLWEKESTIAVANTLKTYSKHTIEYPYPVAISVHAASIGMEYPMICFNGGRPEKDGTYSKRTKYGMIGVIIHEVGHNYFPMIINSDERQWTWMDEGLNTFLQYLTEQEFEKGYPSRRGPAYKIVNYMKGDKDRISPIMTNSESIHQFGNNAYGKPATAMNILRETIMGRELFDYAFKMYSNRWMFKHPNPEDLFRSLEDASSIDLDWFWRGWFYSTDHVDISLDNIKYYRINDQNPVTNKADKKINFTEVYNKDISNQRNKEMVTYRENDKGLEDFYTSYDPFKATQKEIKKYEKFKENLNEDELEIINSNQHFYELEFSNIGGLVMPIILDFTFSDNTNKIVKIPAEIWKKNSSQITKVFAFDKEVNLIELDPFMETADTDRSNNFWPPKMEPSKFELYKYKNRRSRPSDNPMKKKK